MESTEDYVQGETPVAFIGDFGASALAGTWFDYGQVRELGITSDTSITYYGALQWYFSKRYGLLDNILCDKMRLDEIAAWPQVQAMPAFPKKGYCAMVDGVLVVKIS